MCEAAEANVKRRLLIVDDAPDIRTLFSYIFKTAGYEVDLAANGKEALLLLRQGSGLPCLIFLDLMMPTMDGFEFRKIQQADPELFAIPTVVMTALNDQNYKNALGVQDLVRKPMNIDKLIELANKYCS